MRIHRIHLQHVAGVEDRELRFGDGVTVVVGPNEAGKSTVPTALRLLLEEKDRYDNADIRAVRPVHTDADPTIELECTTGDYHLTYRKVFGATAKRRETTLTIHPPTPASLTGDAAHDRMLEILDETVDEELWSALRVQQRHDVGQADLAASGALAAALDAAGEGRSALVEDGSLVERVEQAAAEFWTATGRPRSPLQDADAAVEGARTALSDARARLDEVRDATRRHDRLVEQVEQWRAALPRLRTRVKETTEALDEVTAQRATLADARARVEAATATATSARDAVADRTMLVARVERLDETADDAEEDLARARDAAERAEDAVADAREVRDEARAELDSTRNRLRAAEADVRLLRHEADLAQLDARIEQAAQLHERREDAKARLDDRAPSAAVIRRLESLEEEVRTAAAVLQADLPRVAVDGPADTVVEVDGEAVSLDGGLQRTIDGELVLRVGEVAITVAPGSSATELADRHADARHTLRAALDEAGVDDVAAARERRQAAQDANRDLRQTDDEWTRLTAVDGLDGLRASLDRTRDTVARLRDERPEDRPLPDDVAAAEQLVAAVEGEVDQRRAELATADAALETANGTLAGARTRVAELGAKLESLREQAQEATTTLAEAREAASDDELQQAVAAATTAVADAEAACRDAAAALDELDDDTIRADAEAAAARLESTQRQLHEADVERAQVWGTIEASASAGLGEQVPQLEAALADAEARRDALRHRADALLLLRDTLHRHRDAARARYQAPLKEEVERLGRVVFGSDFTVELDDELRIVRRTMDGRTLELGQLSGGAQEQLAIITRLAAASLVDRTDGVPLILDDALGYADPTRTDRVNTLLADVGTRSQVIVLTCDPDRFTGVRDARVVAVA